MDDGILDPALKRSTAWGAPFGRFGKALGLSWIMPFGTLPLPFHPGLARLLPLAIPLLVLHRMLIGAEGGSGGIGWRGLLIAAAVLAVPLAIPFVNWIALAFRLPLFQSLLFGGAMLLILFEVAIGSEPPWMAALPIAWIGLFLIQRIGGPIYLRRLRGVNQAFDRVIPGSRPLRISGDRTASYHGDWLFRHADIAIVETRSDPGTRYAASDRVRYRLAPADLARIASRLARIKPPGWSLREDGVVAPALDPGGEDRPIHLRIRRHRAPLWLVVGERNQIEIEDAGRSARLIGGSAALVGVLPLFTAFFWTSILGGSRWCLGFARRKPETIGTPGIQEMLLRALPPLGESGPSVHADAEPLIARLDAMIEAELAQARGLLDRLLDPLAEAPETIFPLNRNPELFAPHGRDLCFRLHAAKAKKDERRVRMAARLIAILPDAEFHALSAELITLLNSRELAFRLLDDSAAIDMPEREKKQHVVGGFSLIKWVPELYERLGDLGEPARALIMELGEKGRWPQTIIRAREGLDAPPEA